jgi:hypothetical protein
MDKQFCERKATVKLQVNICENLRNKSDNSQKCGEKRKKAQKSNGVNMVESQK